MNREQVNALHSLFIHCAVVNFDGVKPDYKFYAKKLDELNVPWHVQNRVAEAAATRENVYSRYFKNLLKELDFL